MLGNPPRFVGFVIEPDDAVAVADDDADDPVIDGSPFCPPLKGKGRFGTPGKDGTPDPIPDAEVEADEAPIPDPAVCDCPIKLDSPPSDEVKPPIPPFNIDDPIPPSVPTIESPLLFTCC